MIPSTVMEDRYNSAKAGKVSSILCCCHLSSFTLEQQVRRSAGSKAREEQTNRQHLANAKVRSHHIFPLVMSQIKTILFFFAYFFLFALPPTLFNSDFIIIFHKGSLRSVVGKVTEGGTWRYILRGERQKHCLGVVLVLTPSRSLASFGCASTLFMLLATVFRSTTIHDATTCPF